MVTEELSQEKVLVFIVFVCPEIEFIFLGTTTDGNGFGFGLIQVLETVKRYNGRLDVTSIEGKGTKFQIEFPLVS